MLLGVIPMICFEFLEKKNAKEQERKSGQTRAPTLQRREPTSRRSPMPLHGMPSPRRGRGAKMAPLGYAMT